MSGEIIAAAKALNARKRAILDGGDQGEVTTQEQAALFSGFDLDPDEIEAGRHVGIRAAEGQLAAGVPLLAALGALWIDGLAMGLLIAEARRRGEAGS